MSGPGFAVIDFETTGLFPGGHDRVVEAAVVHVDAAGRITGQWDTLVNPQRDLGPQHVHGIRAAEVLDAPTFREIAGHLVDLLDGRVLVAHNASFDLRFLVAELGRAGYDLEADADVRSLCTMQLARDIIPGAGRTLADCCAAFDIDIDGAHQASADAMATARLLGEYIAATDAEEFWFGHIQSALESPWPASPFHASGADSWRPRGSAGAAEPAAFLSRISQKLPEFAGPAEHQNYFALLDRCMLDRQISAHEANALVALAEEAGIGRSTCEKLHGDYFDALVAVAWSDGVLSAEEIADLAAVAELLSIEDVHFAAALERPATPVAAAAASIDVFRLKAGDEIVLTGDMVRARADWHSDLAARGFVPKPAITKRITLVVAADPDSLSGKARKARDYGIPIVSEAGLRALL